jgi:hypothetical protein
MLTRTKWAEDFIEQFAVLPLVREWVFRGPSRMARGLEKEVCDLVISLRGDALLVQMKCQEDPGSFTDTKRTSWVLKRADSALNQIKGAIRSLRNDEIWCDHPRRGRVSFKPGELRPAHGIVLVENWGDRVALPDTFPTIHDGIPVSYFSVNDFQNVINELRAFPEIAVYLKFRHSLPEDTVRAIGSENVVFLYYLQHGRTFDGWTSFDEASLAANRVSDPRFVLLAARRGEHGAHLLERVADALATRGDNYRDGLPSDLAEGFDPPSRRQNYLRMQENICDLSLDGRKLLGLKLWELIQRLRADQAQDMTFAVAHVDDKPDFLYVLASAKGFDRATLLKRGVYALWAGLPHYGKTAGLYIADRDGQGFELVYLSGSNVTDKAREAGREMFGHLRMVDYSAHTASR